jgi:hypothetical protein
VPQPAALVGIRNWLLAGGLVWLVAIKDWQLTDGPGPAASNLVQCIWFIGFGFGRPAAWSHRQKKSEKQRGGVGIGSF